MVTRISTADDICVLLTFIGHGATAIPRELIKIREVYSVPYKQTANGPIRLHVMPHSLNAQNF